jgi:hypothetical protein
MNQRALCLLSTAAILALSAHAQKSVATAAPTTSVEQSFRDSHYGVRFRIPPGWSLNRKDHQLSTFHLDARSTLPRSEMRAVAILDFNPFPLSTLSGASFYYSVEHHTTDLECEQQTNTVATPDTEARPAPRARDIQNIGGMEFAHGHDEHGSICTEARDEIYTAFRKGSCYRFDLTMNTFCSITSGAEDLTEAEMQDIEARMTGILSTVTFDWEKNGPRPVPVPSPPTPDTRKPLPKTEPDASASAGAL